MMSNKTIGIAVIGTGRAGLIHARNFSKNVKHARLVAMVDSDYGNLQRAGDELGCGSLYTDYEVAIDENPDIDAIVVATPTVLHKRIVKYAAERGKHILCEKPMAMDLAECAQMNEVVQRNKVKFQIGFMRRYDKSFQAAKARIAAGEIGDVVQVKSLTHGPSVPRPWQYDIAKSNGPLAEVNSHDIDTLRWFTASEFKEVYALAGNFRCPEALPQYPDFYDNVSMLSSFDNGTQGFIGGAVSVNYGYDSRVEILGTKGVLFIGSLNANTVLACNRDGLTQSVISSWMYLYEGAYLAEDRDFVDCILEDRTPVATGIDGMMAVKVVNAGNRSIRERRPVQLEEMAK
ncbi:Gfo/Idh/MocA family oxidoreductase [Parapedobacter sp.]